MKLKPDSIGDPDIYLGAKLKKAELDNDVFCWFLSQSKYVQAAARNVEKHVNTEFGDHFEMTKFAPNPFPLDYDPDTDVSSELGAEDASYYQSIIGILRWMVELGRIDIATKVSTLSSYLVMPRRGHMQGALHIMPYLRAKHNSRLVLDSSYLEIDMSEFHGERN